MKKKAVVLILFLLAGAALAGPGEMKTKGEDGGSTLTAELVKLLPVKIKTTLQWRCPSPGVYYADVIKGSGKAPREGSYLFIQAKTYLEGGSKVVDTVNDREPIRYIYHDGLMPELFEDSIAGMKAGGRRLLILSEKASDKIERKYYNRRIFVPGKNQLLDLHLLWVRELEHDKVKKFR